MDNKQVMARIEELLKEKHLTLNALKENTSISTTVYQWKKNAILNERLRKSYTCQQKNSKESWLKKKFLMWNKFVVWYI